MNNIFTLNKTKVSVLLLAFAITGCTSKPREVSASLPLVTFSQEKPNKKEIPTQYWSTLSDSQQTTLQHEKYKVEMSELYTSALGETCRELKITDNQNKQASRIACEIPFMNADNQPDKAWFIEKEIIESSAYIEL